ncbi:unnamed protein product [Rotaria magnacalcarata]|uniref:Uncharacterized protein n=1 Tax=Rotaria magnacalcarata TaxID=392030 RepID=A0A816XPU4_9BILA|nr:unnamed protein product [Rotaria magnacalcarata]CAF4070753.1 unnamed protein product [Rotaria magnacalcarata]
MLHTVSIILFIIGMVTSQQDFGSSGCGCCPDPLCPTASPPCSSNVDCACLFMTMTSGGMCANTVVSCNNLTRCNSDNVTCSVPNTVCVNNTRCNIPVCYPIELASYQQCPAREAPISTTTTIQLHRPPLLGHQLHRSPLLGHQLHRPPLLGHQLRRHPPHRRGQQLQQQQR